MKRTADQRKPFECINLDDAPTDFVAIDLGIGTGRLHRFSRLTKSSVVMFAMVFGLLIWAKLRLVSGMPRSVYADPKHIEQDAGVSQPGQELVRIGPGMPMPPASKTSGAVPAQATKRNAVGGVPPGGYD